jgi:asparagine synthase (glutamine-hydrolysing)
MPGIAGIVAPVASALYEGLAKRMVASMCHQPASATGTLFEPALGLYAGWVAHEESFAAVQSSTTAPSGSALLFAGECFPATAAFDSLLDRYEADGEAFVASLNGLFSGLLVDPQRRLALIFNDRYGSERLYLAEKDGVMYFASEAKALLRVLPELRAFDETGLAQFLTFGSTIDGHTLFRGVRLMPAGSLWRLRAGSPPERTRYFTPADWECQPQLADEDFEARFAATFQRIVPGYLPSRAPVGISLTGGLDTRMIMACLPRPPGLALAYTYAARGSDTLDLRIAARVAASRDIPHHALRIGEDFIADYGRQVDRTVFVTDGSAGALAAHEIHLSERARRLAPVRLTGNFGSEVLRSMSTFKPIALPTAMLDDGITALLASAAAQAQDRAAHPVTHAAFEEVPWHLFGTLAAARSQLTFRTPYLDNEIVQLAYQARPQQRQTARPSLKLIHDSDPGLAKIATDRGLCWDAGGLRSFGRRLFCDVTFKLDYWHKEGLPQALSALDPLLGAMDGAGWLGLHKFLPYRGWFRRELATYLAQVIGDPQTRRMSLWNPRFLDNVVADHVSGRRNNLRQIHTILTLEAVQRTLLSETVRLGPAESAIA